MKGPMVPASGEEPQGGRKGPLPPGYFAAALVAMVVLALLAPVTRVIPFPWNLAGVVPIILGGVLNVLADKQFKAVGTTVKPFESSSVMVTEGVFRFSRNPMYLGMVSVLVGAAILLRELTPWMVVPLFAAAIQHVVHPGGRAHDGRAVSRRVALLCRACAAMGLRGPGSSPAVVAITALVLVIATAGRTMEQKDTGGDPLERWRWKNRLLVYTLPEGTIPSSRSFAMPSGGRTGAKGRTGFLGQRRYSRIAWKITAAALPTLSESTPLSIAIRTRSEQRERISSHTPSCSFPTVRQMFPLKSASSRLVSPLASAAIKRVARLSVRLLNIASREGGWKMGSRKTAPVELRTERRR